MAIASGNMTTIKSLAENAQTTPHKPATLATVVQAKFDTSPFVVIAVGDQLAPQKTWFEELTNLAKLPLETPPKSEHSRLCIPGRRKQRLCEDRVHDTTPGFTT